MRRAHHGCLTRAQIREPVWKIDKGKDKAIDKDCVFPFLVDKHLHFRNKFLTCYVHYIIRIFLLPKLKFHYIPFYVCFVSWIRFCKIYMKFLSTIYSNSRVWILMRFLFFFSLIIVFWYVVRTILCITVTKSLLSSFAFIKFP